MLSLTRELVLMCCRSGPFCCVFLNPHPLLYLSHNILTKPEHNLSKEEICIKGAVAQAGIGLKLVSMESPWNVHSWLYA